MRLNRYLALCGLGSRRAVEDRIRAGQVKINGKVAGLASDVSEKDTVEVGGRVLKAPETHTYLILNKPAGYLCSRGDTHDRETIYDLLSPEYQNLHYVGRLDKESRGLIFLTNDGALTAALTHPRYEVLRIYEARTETPLTTEEFSHLRRGIEVEPGAIYQCAKVETIPGGCRLALREGKKREIRRMLAALGHRVTDLYRTEFGGVELGALPEGKVRPLSKEEVEMLRQAVPQAPNLAPTPASW